MKYRLTVCGPTVHTQTGDWYCDDFVIEFCAASHEEAQARMDMFQEITNHEFEPGSKPCRVGRLVCVHVVEAEEEEVINDGTQ